MSSQIHQRTPDYFGDDEDVLDIQCRPALPVDMPQVALLAAGLLEKVFGPMVGASSKNAPDILLAALQSRLRHDCTWVMHEGQTIVGMIDLETAETRRLNGPSLPRVLAGAMDLTEKIRDTGLLPLLMHEPDSSEAHQSLVALLPGSRGEGRGTLLLMHGAFWSKAQGKDWITTWLRADDPVRSVYERRGYIVQDEITSNVAQGNVKWVLLRRPISAKALRTGTSRRQG
jgi:GNAT superfamily N-acetyltransferase